MSIQEYISNPEIIFDLPEKELLQLVRAQKEVRKIYIPDDALNGDIYTPVNFNILCTPYTGSKRISKGEKKCKEVLESIYKKTFTRVRPDFLYNLRNLELDMFCPNLGIACEYHGKQHYVYPSRYFKKKSLFLEQLRRDLYKLAMCRKVGIYLLTVPYTVKLENIEEFIRQRLP